MIGKPIKVLVVEDDPLSARFIKEILVESGRTQFTLTHVDRLNPAMELLQYEVFDVALLDLNLPDSSGFDTFERFHSAYPSIPVIVLTGLDDEELGMRAVQKGGCYLNKGDIGEQILPRTIQYEIERKRLMADLEQSYQKFYHLSARLQHLREEERKLISHELHDELGGLFTAMKLELAAALGNPDKGQRALSAMRGSLTDLIDRGIDIVQRVSIDLRPHILDQLGLMPAIDWYIKEFQRRAGIQCTWVLSDGDIPLDNDRALAVFRILQEALTNVARHSKASRIVVEASRNEDALQLKIEDNGVGFNDATANNPHSFGLIGMQERAIYLRGQVTIKSVAQKGTTIALTVPLTTMDTEHQ